MQPVIILHHHEIVLKGENRKYFEKQLLKNVRTAVGGLVNSSAIDGGYGRFILHLDLTDITDEILERLSYVFGLSNVCYGVSVEQNVEKFCQAALKILHDRTFKTIRVVTRRPDKNFPTRSMEVNAAVGEFLCKQFNVHANLSEPDETIFIEIVNGEAYVYRAKIKGAGGLPSGVSGKVVSLLSAGFDSPVASWQIMKRGASVIFVHFHSMPYTSQNSIDQVKQIVEILTRYQFNSKLYLVPFLDVQNEIVLRTPQSLRVILYRRMMIRIAEAISRKEKAEALVTGEAVGQVASQTLRNIRNIDQVATFPILRPLSGMDKEETIAIARKIKTHDISKEPYDDCCSFLAPRKPETWSNIEKIDEAESNLDIQSLLEKAVNEAKIERYIFPSNN
ncbi:MAG: tRNA uracil 4-sulfurtransferase ThiI [Bacteroidota bacterium]|nr:tRNA uracil 4-sulfurtransferase ThiI [Bacteroidota bacterium]